MTDTNGVISPSGSIGWNIMNEDFFEDLKETFNEVKLRGSYGEYWVT